MDYEEPEAEEYDDEMEDDKPERYDERVVNIDDIKVCDPSIYRCNRKRCPHCWKYCHYTTDPRYAVAGTAPVVFE